jgi:hypothetical protein
MRGDVAGERQEMRKGGDVPRSALALLAALMLAAPMVAAPLPARAIGSLQWGDYSLEATGSLRVTGAFLHYPETLGLDDDGLAAGVARLLLEGALGERVGYRANLFFELNRSPQTLGGGALSTAGSFASPYRTSYLVWDFWEDGAVAGQMGVDRLAVDVRLSPLELSVGRMPLNYSVTHILTPNDFFAAFSAAAINKVYKPGVDALRVNYALGPLSSLELAAVLGSLEDDTPDWSRSALLLRASATAWEIEWALLGGKLAGRWIAGASLQGEMGPFGIRLEGHVGFPDEDGDGKLDGDEVSPSAAAGEREIHLHVAAGVDKTFEWRSLNVAFEAMFLSDGAMRPDGYLARFKALYPDDQLYLNRMYLGLSVGGEVLPILRAVGLALWNTQDLSGLGALFLVHSAADEVEVAAGVLLPWGDEALLQSEYGMVPVMAFLEARVYF